MKKTATHKTKESKKPMSVSSVSVERNASTGRFIESNMPNLLKNRPLKIKFY
jgi:hypothetical protein